WRVMLHLQQLRLGVWENSLASSSRARRPPCAMFQRNGRILQTNGRGNASTTTTTTSTTKITSGKIEKIWSSGLLW
ncbi:hypothetical protein P3X46_034433, partial [Hevea brasiliensis]